MTSELFPEYKEMLHTREKLLHFIFQYTIFACVIIVLFLHRSVNLSMIIKIYLEVCVLLHCFKIFWHSLRKDISNLKNNVLWYM